jgi:hypothetical protein
LQPWTTQVTKTFIHLRQPQTRDSSDNRYCVRIYGFMPSFAQRLCVAHQAFLSAPQASLSRLRSTRLHPKFHTLSKLKRRNECSSSWAPAFSFEACVLRLPRSSGCRLQLCITLENGSRNATYSLTEFKARSCGCLQLRKRLVELMLRCGYPLAGDRPSACEPGRRSAGPLLTAGCPTPYRQLHISRATRASRA